MADGHAVGSAQVGSGDGYVRLDHGLNPGQLVWAEQVLPGGIVSGAPADTSKVQVLAHPTQQLLSGIHSPSPLMQCGTCLYLRGVVPGAEVTVSRASEPDQTVTAEWTTVRFVVPPFGNDEVVAVSQHRGSMAGGSVLPPALNRPEGSSLPPPALSQPLYVCQSVVEFESLLPGAAVDLHRNGDVATYGFGHTSGRGRLSAGLELGDKLSVSQHFAACKAGSLPSAAYEVTQDTPPTPWFPARVCVSDRDVEVAGVIKGAAVDFLIGTGTGTVVHAVAGSPPYRFNLPPLGNVETLGVRQSLCQFGKASDTTWTQLVAAGAPDHPLIVEPLHGCAAAVCVRDRTGRGLAEGTRIYVTSRRWAGSIGTAVCVGDTYTDVRLDFPLTAGDELSLETVRCGLRHAFADTFPVVHANEDFAPPEIMGFADDAGRTLAVNRLVPGCWCELEEVASLFQEEPGLPLIAHPCTREIASVPVPPLRPGMFLRAAQRVCASRSGRSPAKQVVDARPRYVSGSADRISQLTGRRGPEKRGARFDTYTIGLKGTDLGIPVWHGGLYLFFGDSDEYAEDDGNVPADRDPIAWTFDRPEEPKGPLLNWVIGPLGWYQRLHVTGLPELGNFEVPTGAFSYGGRLYVFVARNKAGGVMRDSHLAVTKPPNHVPGDGLVKLYDVSSTLAGGWPAGRWLTHVSPTVVSCAAWPGLPVATGDGLVMFSTSLYHASSVHLAFCTLDPLGVQPVPDPATWWYFLDGAPADGAGPANWRTATALLDSGQEPTEVIPGLGGQGEVSVTWHPRIHRWLQANMGPSSPGDPYEAIHVRTARRPQGPWSQSVVVFDPADPDAEASNSDPQNQFVRLPNPQPPPQGNLVYAPYVVPSWTRFDRSTREITIYYTVSTTLPVYNVQLLTARIHLGPTTP
ncbi:hypothetical protein ACODT3_01280 [Streptomyces sp. 4.24]|uniref:hypothetical protein n=1 Tax=Streptomyces tritrimontium TaxID=3406573 RepID=UPI003BB54D58